MIHQIEICNELDMIRIWFYIFKPLKFSIIMKNDKMTDVDYSTTRIEEYSTIIFDLH